MSLVPGVSRVGWCDECFLSHAFVTAYLMREGSAAASPVGVWADHNEE